MRELRGGFAGCLACLLLALAGCPQRPPVAPSPLVLAPAVRSVTVWPTALAAEAPGDILPPWPPRPGEHLELWRIDLSNLDCAEPAAWLEAWQPRPERLASPVLVQPSPGDPRRLRVAEAGAYVLRSVAGREAYAALVLASRLRLALTLADDDCEVFCADARTGRPVRGAYVQVIYRTERLGRERLLRAAGSTDADGRWHTALVRDRFAAAIVATAVATHGSECAMATERRVLDHREATCRLMLRSRATVYRPGRTAEVAGVLQSRAGRGFAPWPDAQLRLWLFGPADAVAATARARTDEAGAFTCTFDLPADAAPGRYTLAASIEDAPHCEPPRAEGVFSVAAPTAVPFRLKLSLDRAVVAPGEALELKVQAQRPDGSPLGGARVRVLTWACPVALGDDRGEASWTLRPAPLDSDRLIVLPANLPPATKTDATGRATLRWEPGEGDFRDEDLLCGVQVEVATPELGSAERTTDFVLLRRPPPVALETQRQFFSPAEPIELTFRSALPAADQAATVAVCTLEVEDASGEPRRRELARVPVAALVANRLTTTASRPGRYTFGVEAAGGASEVSVWVVEDGKDLPWSGATSPMLIPERRWVRRGEGLRAVVAAPARGAPLALTLRSSGAVRRLLVSLDAAARCIAVEPDPGDEDSLEALLVQVAGGQCLAGRASIGIEPGGRALDVQSRLLWVRQGEWSGRGYGVTTRDPLGQGLQSVVHLELVRPAFEGSPPVAIERATLHWHPGKATSEHGEIEVGFHDSLLASATSLLVQGVAPDGRTGLLLMPLATPPYAPDLKPAARRGPRDRLGALVSHGLDTPVSRWLAGRLLAQHGELARELPALIGSAASDEEATEILRLAMNHPSAAPAAVAAALKRGGTPGPAALTLAGSLLPEHRALLESALRSDPSPLARAAAARSLARALPGSLASLADALRADADPLVRAAAASALAGGGRNALAPLAEAVRGDDAQAVRLAALAAIGQVGGNDAAGVLLEVTADAAEEALVAALRALGELGYSGFDERLLRIVQAGPVAARVEAARLLARTDTPEAAEALLAAVRRSPSGALLRAVAPMRSRPVQEAMARWLSHPDPDVRLAAAEHLAALRDERAPGVLRAFLEPDAPSALADGAAAALLALRDEAAVPRLVALLEGGRLGGATRRELVRTAGRLGWQQAAPALVGILWQGLADPQRLRSPEGRQLWLAAAEAIAAIGPLPGPLPEAATGPVPSASPYAPALAALRAEGLASFFAALWRLPAPADLRRQAVLSYARLRGPAAAGQLVQLLESPVLQGAAFQALADADAAVELVSALRSRSAVVRAGAAAALGATGEPSAAAALRPLLRDHDPFVRCEAAWALAAITRQPVAYTDHLGELRETAP